MDYKFTDKVISYINRHLVREFARLNSILSYDELNVMNSVNAVYGVVLDIIRAAYVKLADNTYKANVKKIQRNLDEVWLDEILEDYDPVSKFVFYNEFDRRRARLIEALLASDNPRAEADAALKSLSLLNRDFAVRVTDEAVKQAYRDDEEEYVIWIAEKDDRTCSECWDRDGRIYETDMVPPKPHRNCRCTIERVGDV